MYTKLLPLLFVIGCAAEEELSARNAPVNPLKMTVEGLGVFEGRAEYEVSEPTPEFVPVARLVLWGQASGSSVTMRLGQRVPGEFDSDYEFPALENAFLVELDGKAFEGRFGSVEITTDGKLEGTFELESVDLDGADLLMMKGSFVINGLFLNCNKLATVKFGSSPGQKVEVFVWEPDSHIKSEFCREMQRQLGPLYGEETMSPEHRLE